MPSYSNKLLFFIIIITACLTQVAADIYTPSISAIAQHFSSPIALVEITMVSYLVGVALSQLFFGPLSEGVGRKKPVLVGLGIMLVGSFLAYIAQNIYFLIFARLIQGVGAGACAGLWRSIIRDVLSGEQLAKVGSYFAIVITFVVPAAPALGGWIQQSFNWQANFLFILCLTFFSFLMFLYGFKETSQNHHPSKLNLNFVKKTFATLLKSSVFMGACACTFFAYGALFSCITTLPILLIHRLNMEPVSFGWLIFLGTAIAYFLSSLTNSKLVTVFGIKNMMRLGYGVMLSAGLVLLMMGLFFEMTIENVSLPVFMFYYGCTFIWPNAFAMAFTPFGNIAGYAGALYGFIQICGGAFITGLISMLPSQSQIPLSVVILSTSSIGWIILEKMNKKEKAVNHGLVAKT